MFFDRKNLKTSWNFSDPDQKETDPQHWFLGRTLNWESGLSLKKSFFLGRTTTPRTWGWGSSTRD